MRFVPHAYQKYCIHRLLQEPALGLFLDMGLGKTVITLTAINDLRYNRFQVKKVLVVAPKKVAEDTWTREAGKWEHLKMLRVIPVLGSVTKRVRALNSPADIYVINRENIPWLVEYYKNLWPFDMVVIDELSSFKNPQAKRFKSLKLVRSHIKRMVGLTGTPAPNGLLDLWAQVYLLDFGERLGKTIGQYRTRYFQPGKRSREQIFSYEAVDGAEEAIKSRISDICISLMAKDYLELPGRIDDTRHVRLEPKAQKLYKQMEKDMLLEVDETTIDAASAAVLSNKLLQLCNGAVYDEAGNIVEIHKCKLEALTELIEELNGQPALIFYNFKHDLIRIQQALKKYKLKVGELKDSNTITSWNNRELDILLAHPASAAYGLNLQEGGNHIIWFGLNWSLELYQQANARLYRQGQKERVFIHHLTVDGCQDEFVMDALENKNTTQESLLNALKAKIKALKEENT